MNSEAIPEAIPKAILELTNEQAEALTYVIGDILDGRGNFDGTTLFEVEPIYEQLTEAKPYQKPCYAQNCSTDHNCQTLDTCSICGKHERHN